MLCFYFFSLHRCFPPYCLIQEVKRIYWLYSNIVSQIAQFGNSVENLRKSVLRIAILVPCLIFMKIDNKRQQTIIIDLWWLANISAFLRTHIVYYYLWIKGHTLRYSVSMSSCRSISLIGHKIWKKIDMAQLQFLIALSHLLHLKYRVKLWWFFKNLNRLLCGFIVPINN